MRQPLLLTAFAALPLLTPAAAVAQAPVNDAPAGAIDILARRGLATFQRVNTAAATQTATLPCAAVANDDDVFFSFEAAGPGLRLEYRDLTAATAGAGVGYAVFDAATGELLGCDYELAAGPRGAGFVDLSRALTVGQSYTLALFTSAPGGGVFDFRLTAHDFPRIAPNPGDDCLSVTVDVDGSGGRVQALAPDGTLLLSLGNGEALGATTVTLRGHRGERPRESGSGLVYDRNVTVTPSTAPTQPVAVDFYVTTAEFLHLAREAGTGPGFASYKVIKTPGTSCSPTYGGGGEAFPLATAFDYPGGYRLAIEVTDFSEFFLVPAVVPFPVELLSFEARAETDGNVVEWRAANEVDLGAYVLERAGQPGEAASWTTVAEVRPRGTDGGAVDYAATDRDPLPTSYYRLRQVDLDGTEALSPTVVVERGELDGALALFPNPSPSGTAVTLTLPHAYAEATVSVRDATGRELRSEAVAGRRTLSLPVGGLSAGLYSVEVQTANGARTERLVVQ